MSSLFRKIFILADFEDCMEPPRPRLSEGIVKRDSKLFGIVGWFSQPEMDIDCAAFGGYFRYDVKDKLVVDGQLIDLFGKSKIEGKMDETSLEFVKKYSDLSSSNIHYKFVKQNGIWVGSYGGQFVIGNGDNAKCITTLLEEDAFTILCGEPKLRSERF